MVTPLGYLIWHSCAGPSDPTPHVQPKPGLLANKATFDFTHSYLELARCLDYPNLPGSRSVREVKISDAVLTGVDGSSVNSGGCVVTSPRITGCDLGLKCLHSSVLGIRWLLVHPKAVSLVARK